MSCAPDSTRSAALLLGTALCIGLFAATDSQALSFDALRFNSGSSHCKSFWPGARQKCKGMVFGFVSRPAASQVRNLVVISAGHQDFDKTVNVGTGQPENYTCSLNWKKSCQKRVTLDSRSLAMRIVREGLFDASETLFVVIMNSQLGPIMSASEAGRVVDGWRRYLESQMTSGALASLERVVLGSSSQGGRLGLYLAREWFDRGHRNPTIFLGLDTTLVQKDEPHFTSSGSLSQKVDNPLRSGWKARVLHTNRAFGAFNHVFRAHQVVSGMDVFLGIRGTVGIPSYWVPVSNPPPFSVERYSSGYSSQDIELWRTHSWWENQWIDQRHGTLNTSYAAHDLARTVQTSFGYLVGASYDLDGQGCSDSARRCCLQQGADACYVANGAGPMCWFYETTSNSCNAAGGNWQTPESSFVTSYPDVLPGSAATCAAQAGALGCY